MIEVNKKVSKILNDIGIPHSRSCELIDLFDKRNCINSNNFQFVCSHLVVILNILTKIVGNLRHYEHEVPILIKYLDDNERDLNSMDLGVLKHMKAIKTWKIDNDPYFPTLYLNDSIAILEKIGSGEATAYLARIFDTYGQLLVSKGYLNEAKIEFQKALDIKEQSNDEVGLAITTGNIGRLYMQIGDFDKAIRYLKKDYEIIFKTETENSNLKAQLLSTISNCYMQLQKYTTAKENNDKSYILNKSTNNYTGLVFNYLNQAEVNLITKDFKEAKFAINAAEKIINKNLVAQFFIENFRGRIIEIKARILYLEGNFKLSLKLFEEALKIFDIELSFTNVEIAKFLKNFADIAKTVKQNEYSGHLYRRALKYLDSTEEVSCRKEIENELRENHKDSWMLHSAGRYIGHDQIDFLLNNAGATNFVGEEKEVVVLFMDIRGFTSLSEKLDPNQLIEVLNGFLATMTKAITQFGGFVDKFIGDAIMAVFSLPNPNPDGDENDAQRALKATLLMKEELIRYNRNLPKFIPELKIGIGLHSGKATTGLIGSPQKKSYTLIGDVVNTASRIEGMTKILGADILVSNEVIKNMKSKDIILRPLGKFKPKGRKCSVEVSEIMGFDDKTNSISYIRKECEVAKSAAEYFKIGDFKNSLKTYNILKNTCKNPYRSKGYEFLSNISAKFEKQPLLQNWTGEIPLHIK